MAQQLWLLRHGEAEPHHARDDSERRLTPRGERQARDAGQALARLGVEIQAIYTSPRLRALDTARLAGEHLGLELRVVESLSGGWSRDDALELLAGQGEDACILVVGHEPDFSHVVQGLTGGRIDLKKGGIAAVRVGGSGAVQFVLLRPKELEALAEA